MGGERSPVVVLQKTKEISFFRKGKKVMRAGEYEMLKKEASKLSILAKWEKGGRGGAVKIYKVKNYPFIGVH